MLNREHPAVHACDLCQLAAPLGSLSYDVLQAGQFLFTLPDLLAPFFCQPLQASLHCVQILGSLDCREIQRGRAVSIEC